MKYRSITAQLTLIVATVSCTGFAEPSSAPHHYNTEQNEIALLHADLGYIETFLIKLHDGNFLINSDELEVINHDLNHIKKHIKRISDKDYRIKTNLSKEVAYLHKITRTQKRIADESKMSQKPIVIIRTVKQVPSQTTQQPFAFLERSRDEELEKKEQLRQLLLLKQEHDAKKEEDMKEFDTILGISCADETIEQPNQNQKENLPLNRSRPTTNTTELFIENHTKQQLTIHCSSIDGAKTTTMEVAPGQISPVIYRDNIKTLTVYRYGAPTANIIDPNTIQERVIRIK